MELYPWAASHPILFTGLAGLSLILLAAGTRRLLRWRKSPCARRHRTLAPGAFRIRHFHGVRHHLFEWYLLFLLPGIVAATALGLDGWRLVLSRNKIGAVAGILLVAASIGAYVGLYDAAKSMAAQPSDPANPRICRSDATHARSLREREPEHPHRQFHRSARPLRRQHHPLSFRSRTLRADRPLGRARQGPVCQLRVPDDGADPFPSDSRAFSTIPPFSKKPPSFKVSIPSMTVMSIATNQEAPQAGISSRNSSRTRTQN